MTDNFNKDAMREKIRINLEKGWNIESIRLALMEEKLAALEKMQNIEARVVELTDQIEFIDEEHVRPN